MLQTNVLSEDGSKSLTSLAYSPDRQLVAYAVATSVSFELGSHLKTCRG